MKNLISSTLCALVICSAASADDWGNIKGRVLLKGDVPEPVLMHAKGANIKDAAVCAAGDVYKDDLVIDKETKGIANVFVYMVKAPRKVHPDATVPEEKVIFDQKNCVFKPHALVVRAGQTVEVLNSDAIAHNTHTHPLRNTAVNILIAPNTAEGAGEDIETVSRESVPHQVKCDYHPWMLAFWLVVDHPYAAATNSKGEFEIKNLPVGTHKFRLWHERKGYLTRAYEVTVKAGDNELEPLVYELSTFEE